MSDSEFACADCGGAGEYTIEPLEGERGLRYSCGADLETVVNMVSDETGYPAVVSFGRVAVTR